MRTFGKGNCTDNARSGNTEKDRDFKCRGIQTSAISMGSLFWYRSWTRRERTSGVSRGDLSEKLWEDRTSKSNSICCIVNRKNSPRWKSGYLFKIDNRNGVRKLERRRETALYAGNSGAVCADSGKRK